MEKFDRFDPAAAEFYGEHGYVVIKSLIDMSVLCEVRDQIVDIFETGFGCPGGGFELMCKSYTDQRKNCWQLFAKRMGYVPSLMAAAGAASVRQTLNLLGVQKPIISTHPEVRTDMPSDIRYQQPWHQDWRYGQSSMNSVTIWTPLHDMSPELGPVCLLPSTHRHGLYPYSERLAPRAFLIDQEAVSLPLERSVQANLVFGESVIFSQFLIHGSMNNYSSGMRLTFQLRYADLAEEKFRKNCYRVPTGSELVWDSEP